MARIKVFQIKNDYESLKGGITPELIEKTVNLWLEENEGKIEIINSSLVDIAGRPYAWVMITYRLVEARKEVEKPKTKSEPPRPIVLPKKDGEPVNPNRHWRENHPDLDGWG